MLYNDLKYVNVANTIEVHTTLEFKNCNFQYIFLNWIISVIQVTQFGTHVVENHVSDLLFRAEFSFNKI